MTWVVLGEISSKIALLFATFASARLLQPNDFAVYSGFLAIILTSAAVSDAGVSQLFTRELAGGTITTQRGLRQVAGFKILLLPLWAVIFAASTYLLVTNQHIDRNVVAGYAFASLLIVIQLPLLAALRGRMSFRDAAASQAIGRWLTATIMVAALFLSRFDEHAVSIVLSATVIGEAAIVVIAVLTLRGLLGDSDAHDNRSLTIRRSLPFAANTVLSLVYNRMDIVIVAALTTAAQLNDYAPASRIQDAAYVLPTAVTTVSFPLFAKIMSDPESAGGGRAQRRFLLVLGLSVTIPAMLVLTIYTPQFIGIVLGDEFIGSVTATRILVWSIPFSVVNAALLAQLTAGPRPAVSTWVFLTAFVTSLVLQVLLTPKFGAVGAALASFAREPFAMVTAILLMVGNTGRRSQTTRVDGDEGGQA